MGGGRRLSRMAEVNQGRRGANIEGDFVDVEGKPIPQFEAYFDAIHTITNAQGKVGQLDAADLKNFETAMNIYGRQAAVSYGFPARYFGITTSNPPAEGAIRAD